MTKNKKLVVSGLLVAIAVVGSMFSFPVFGSKCSPVQHLVNVLAAVCLGPWYVVIMAFAASVIRIACGLGTFMAFPGSMCGAFLAGIFYKAGKKVPYACVGELIGTSLIGGLLAYPVAFLVMGNKTAAVFGYIIPFLISSVGGTVIAAILIIALKKTGVLKDLEK